MVCVFDGWGISLGCLRLDVVLQVTEAKLKVAINGFGRIGRNFLRCARVCERIHASSTADVCSDIYICVCVCVLLLLASDPDAGRAARILQSKSSL